MRLSKGERNGNQEAWVLCREVTAKLVLDRCVGVEHAEKGRCLKDQRSNSLLPPTLIPCPLSPTRSGSRNTEVILDPAGRGANAQHCTARLHPLAKHTPAALVPVKCISRLICSLNEMWRQFTPRSHWRCFKEQYRYHSTQEEKWGQPLPSLYGVSPLSASDPPRHTGT